jgi:hypothetical protein
MEIFRELFDGFEPLQITWAMIFAALGYLIKTAVDYNLNRKKSKTEQIQNIKFENIKEQDNFRKSLMTHVYKSRNSIKMILHQLLRHAKYKAEDNDRYKTRRPEFNYEAAEFLLAIGNLRAQLKIFLTYQFTQLEKSKWSMILIEKIEQFESILSYQGIYRGYQESLALFATKTPHNDLLQLLQSSDSFEEIYIEETTKWAKKIIYDFYDAWLEVFRVENIESIRYLMASNDFIPDKKENLNGIDLSKYVPKLIESDITAQLVNDLRVKDHSFDFIRGIDELWIALNDVFGELEKKS